MHIGAGWRWGRNKCSALEVPMQRLLVLREKVHSRQGKALGSDIGNGFGSGLCCYRGNSFAEALLYMTLILTDKEL
jgi:hypothetical protein